MTTGTVAPEVAVMDIVRCVAGHAFVRQLYFVCRLNMALLASQLGMCSLAREARRGMVELPMRPTIWIMTSSAPFAEGTLVVVVCLVARDALGWRTAVAAVRMALFASHGSVQTH
jgi:hypothetical protein